MRLRPLGSFGLEADDINAPFSEIWDAFFASMARQVSMAAWWSLAPQ